MAGNDWMATDLRTGVSSYHDYDLANAANTFNAVEYKTWKHESIS